MDEKPWPQHEVLRGFIPRGQRVKFALTLGVTRGYLDILCSGAAVPSGDLCRTIESETLGKVTRIMLRPDLFGSIEEAG
tara:strand:- start:272 stop:508 length:237 start_codon:yes stop_codon:yes gene_type:complete